MEKKFLTFNDFPLELEKTSELYMTFSLSGKIYAIQAKQIIEIVQLPELNILEKVPEYIVGLMNLRGKIISVIDLRKFLGIQQTIYSTEHQVLIINNSEKIIGIIVDSVNDVIQFNKEQLEPLPYQSSEKFISGIYKNSDSLIAFLNLDIIVNNIKAIQTESSDSLFKSPTYISADLFPTDKLSQEKFKKRAVNLKKEIKVDIDKSNYQENRFVSFSLNNEIYCLSLKYVKEFCKLKLINLTPIPCVPEFITGLFNLRGEFITIIDIKSFLQIPKTKITDKTKIIVVKLQNFQIGLVVDDVFDIVNISTIKMGLSASAKFEKNKYTSAEIMLEDGGVMSILDLEKFLEDDKLIVEDAI
ncbi:MAG: chemotaxis protein CheW [bacterium]